MGQLNLLGNLPWFFSDRRERVAGRNISISSGTFRIILKAHTAAFFLMYALEDLRSLSTSPAKSRDISGEAIAPRVQSANPCTNCVEEFKSLENKYKGISTSDNSSVMQYLYCATNGD